MASTLMVQRKALFEEGQPLADMNFNTAVVYGWVASHVTRLYARKPSFL